MDKILHLSITKKDVPTRIDVVQYATKPSIVFVLDDYIPGSGARANLYIKKPDGTKIYNSCTISGNQITYKPTTQSFASLGTNKCQLDIIESDGEAISFLIYADVTENIIDSSAVESTDEFTALVEALQDVEGFESNAFMWRRTLATGTDLNTITEMGRYHFATSTNVTNAPDGVVWGGLEVLRNSASGTVIFQRITSNNRIYLRQSIDSGGTWTAWATFISAQTIASWASYSATYKGLSISVKINNAIPGLVRIKVTGTLTEEIATGSGYLTIATFSNMNVVAGTLGYVTINGTWESQLRLQSGGQVQLGYTKRKTETAATNLASGAGVYIDQAFIIA